MGSGSSTLWPPTTGEAALRPISGAARPAPRRAAERQLVARPGHEVQREQRPPAHRVDVGRPRSGAAIRPQCAASSTTGVKKSVVTTSARRRPAARRPRRRRSRCRRGGPGRGGVSVRQDLARADRGELAGATGAVAELREAAGGREPTATVTRPSLRREPPDGQARSRRTRPYPRSVTLASDPRRGCPAPTPCWPSPRSRSPSRGWAAPLVKEAVGAAQDRVRRGGSPPRPSSTPCSTRCRTSPPPCARCSTPPASCCTPTSAAHRSPPRRAGRFRRRRHLRRRTGPGHRRPRPPRPRCGRRAARRRARRRCRAPGQQRRRRTRPRAPPRWPRRAGDRRRPRRAGRDRRRVPHPGPARGRPAPGCARSAPRTASRPATTPTPSARTPRSCSRCTPRTSSSPASPGPSRCRS